MKIRPVGAQLFHADRQKDTHDEANSRSSSFCERAYKHVSQKNQYNKYTFYSFTCSDS